MDEEAEEEKEAEEVVDGKDDIMEMELMNGELPMKDNSKRVRQFAVPVSKPEKRHIRKELLADVSQRVYGVPIVDFRKATMER